MKDMKKLIGRLQVKVSDVQFDIDWMKKTNKEQGKEIYDKAEMWFVVGKKMGLNMAIDTILEEIADREQAAKLNESFDKMMSLLDDMKKIIDNEKQPESNTPAAEV